MLANDAYTLKIRASDIAGNIFEDLIHVTTDNAKILSNSALPSLFSPDGDGDSETTTFSAVFTMLLDWTLVIEDDLGVLVKQFSGHGISFDQIWDGMNSAGSAIVDDGIYNYIITVSDPSRSDQASGNITVDKEPPIVEITSPTDGQVISSTVPIAGTASDVNLTSYTVEYGLGDAPSSWTVIEASSVSVVDNLLSNWTTQGLENVMYTIRVRADDVAGHTSSYSVSVSLDNIEVTDVLAAPPSMNPSTGEVVDISYVIDRPADMTVKIYNLDDIIVRTLVDSESRPQGVNYETWDGKDDSGDIVPDSGYTITINADNGRGWYQSSGGYVQNLDFVIDFNVTDRFNPYDNEFCEIEYTLLENSLFSLGIGQDENYATDKWHIRNRPTSVGSHVYYWNGRDDNENILDYYSQGRPIVVVCNSLSLPENTIIVISSDMGRIDVATDAYAAVSYYGDITNITYTIPFDGTVSVSMIKPKNTLVRTLVNSVSQVAGSYTVTWDGTDSSGNIVSSGDDYIIKIELVSAGESKKREGNITIKY